MLTGLPPSQHGVTWNSDRPEKGPLAVPTVFSLAKAAGLKTAMVVGKTKLKLLAGTGNVDSEVLETGPPHEVAMQALDILTQKDPDLLFVHFAAADGEGHDYGWGNSATGQPPSPEYEGALAACDRATAEILKSVHSDGRWRTTLLILTADHGGKEKNHGGEDPQETSIPWVADGGLVVARGELRVPVVTEDTAATALSALGIPVPAGWTGRPVPGVLSSRPAGAALRPAA
jgi:arylsulfatase A-like enzyme